MKRIFTTLCMVLATTAMIAQHNLQDERMFAPEKVQEFDFQNRSSKANQSTDWYNYAREITNISTNMPYYRYTLFPDSTVQVEYSDGMGYVWTHSWGQVFDPTSEYFLFDSDPISKTANYTLDSIAIPYRYNRPRDFAPDTFIIQVFTHSQLTFVPDPSWSTPKSYARAPYDYMARKGDSPAMEIEIILDNDDTTTAVQGIIQEAINMAVLPDEKIAVTMNYFPGSPVNVDDTVDFYMSPPAGDPANSMLVYGFVDEQPVIENYYYNMNLLVPTSVRYNDTANTNGWEENYIPGVAWLSGTYHADMFFQITYDDFTGIEDASSEAVLDLYPNPASSLVNVNYKIDNGQQAIIEFRDILGNLTYTEYVDVMQTRTDIDVSSWTKGVYFYTLKVDGEIQGTSRLVITE